MRSLKDCKRGLYGKFKIQRFDGSSESGSKHERCRYFVLDLTHDQFSIPALKAYADACRGDFPLLARDLDAICHGNRRPLRKIILPPVEHRPLR